MRKFLLAFALLMTLPMAATAGPKEDAFQVIERFKKAFDSADVPVSSHCSHPTRSFSYVSPKLNQTRIFPPIPGHQSRYTAKHRSRPNNARAPDSAVVLPPGTFPALKKEAIERRHGSPSL